MDLKLFCCIIIFTRGSLFWDMFFRTCHKKFCCYVLSGKYEYCQGDVREISGNFEEVCCYEPWKGFSYIFFNQLLYSAKIILVKFHHDSILLHVNDSAGLTGGLTFVEQTTRYLVYNDGCDFKATMMASSNGKIFPRYWPFACGEFIGPVKFPSQKPMTRSFEVFFDLRLE